MPATVKVPLGSAPLVQVRPPSTEANQDCVPGRWFDPPSSGSGSPGDAMLSSRSPAATFTMLMSRTAAPRAPIRPLYRVYAVEEAARSRESLAVIIKVLFALVERVVEGGSAGRYESAIGDVSGGGSARSAKTARGRSRAGRRSQSHSFGSTSRPCVRTIPPVSRLRRPQHPAGVEKLKARPGAAACRCSQGSDTARSGGDAPARYVCSLVLDSRARRCPPD